MDLEQEEEEELAEPVPLTDAELNQLSNSVLVLSSIDMKDENKCKECVDIIKNCLTEAQIVFKDVRIGNKCFICLFNDKTLTKAGLEVLQKKPYCFPEVSFVKKSNH